jgi:curli biogenesis system outer membrane secretion channel CsgG
MRRIADGVIIGLFVLRLFPGGMLRRMTESTFIALFCLSVLSACSTQSAKTMESEKTVHYAAATDLDSSQPVVTEKQTTKTEEKTESDGQRVGLLSGTVHVVGEVIALPFRAVAGLINLAF